MTQYAVVYTTEDGVITTERCRGLHYAKRYADLLLHGSPNPPLKIIITATEDGVTTVYESFERKIDTP